MSLTRDETTNATITSSIRMVIQRYRKASLLIDEKYVVTVGDDGNEPPSSISHCGDAKSSASILLGRNTSKEGDGNANTRSNEDDSSGGTTRSHIGMLVYISFSKTATPVEVQRAAKTILNLPIQTEGAWGDGSSTKSILQAAALTVVEVDRDSLPSKGTPTAAAAAADTKKSANVSIVLVPQANLIAKIKKNGKSVQYRDQIDKTRGEELYDMFVNTVQEYLMEEHRRIQTTTMTSNSGMKNNNNSNSNINGNNKGNDTLDPSVPPKELFRYRQKQQQQQDGSLLYGSFDESTGFPLSSADGEPLTKSAAKRIKKLYDAHAKRHEKYLSKQQPEQKAQQQSNNNNDNDDSGALSPPSSSASPSTASTPTPIVATNPTDNAQQTANTIKCGTKHNKDELPLPNVVVDPSFVQLVAGSFGKRQGLELVSDMGPFCHVIEL